MQDCRLVLQIRDGKVDLDGENISLVELTELCGVIQIFAGIAAMKRGADIDTVKDSLLDVHLAAMRKIETDMKKMEEE